MTISYLRSRYSAPDPLRGLREESSSYLLPPSFTFTAAGVCVVALIGVYILERVNRSRRWPSKEKDTCASRCRGYRATKLALIMMTVSLLIWGGIKVDFKKALSLLLAFPALVAVVEVHALRGQQVQVKNKQLTEDKFDIHNTISLEATDGFQNLYSPLISVILTGVVQMCLLGMYIWALWAAGKPNFEESKTFIFYGFAMFVQVAYIFGRDLPQQAKESREFWATLFYVYDSDWNPIRTSIPWMDQKGIYLRYAFSVIINTFGLVTILLGLPLQVATNEDPFDFVLNVTAAYFIVEFDDLSDTVLLYFTPKKPLRQRDEIKQDFEQSLQNAQAFIEVSTLLPNEAKTTVLMNAEKALGEMNKLQDKYAKVSMDSSFEGLFQVHAKRLEQEWTTSEKIVDQMNACEAMEQKMSLRVHDLQVLLDMTTKREMLYDELSFGSRDSIKKELWATKLELRQVLQEILNMKKARFQLCAEQCALSRVPLETAPSTLKPVEMSTSYFLPVFILDYINELATEKKECEKRLEDVNELLKDTTFPNASDSKGIGNTTHDGTGAGTEEKIAMSSEPEIDMMA